MAVHLVLAQVLPRAENLAALFAAVLDAPRALVHRVVLLYVVAHEPLCYPYQATVRLSSALYVLLDAPLVEALEEPVRLHLFRVRGNVAPDDVRPV